MFSLSRKAVTWVVGVTVFSVLISAGITFLWYELDSNVTRFDVLAVAITIPMICAPISTYLGMKSREKIERLAQENERIANTDALTSLANRRAFFHHISLCYENRSSSTHPVAFIICDVDNFKVFNDQYGHATGDAVLIHVAKLIQSTLPERAFLARIGGEEFAIRCDCRVEDANLDQIASSLVKTVSETPFLLGDSTHTVTISVGVFIGTNHSPPETALSFADKAMYEAKSKGRNQFFRAA